MSEYQVGPGDEIDINVGGLYGFVSKLMMVGTLVLGLGALIVVIVAKTLEEVFEAKASAAWARAAQLDAQANLVDARTAQLGTLWAGLTPIILVSILLGAALAFAIIVYMAKRDGPQHLVIHNGSPELYVPEPTETIYEAGTRKFYLGNYAEKGGRPTEYVPRERQ